MICASKGVIVSMPVLLPENRNSRRINAALNFAHANFHANPNLDSLADVACLSKFHFLRLFHDQVGESPVGFLKRIRLERSACLLSYADNRPILDVALSCGFSSGEHFSRSFAEMFGRCPREYRSVHRFNLWGDFYRQRFRAEGIAYDQQSSGDQMDIVKCPPIRVAYVRNIGSYGDSSGGSGIREAMDSITKWAKSHRLWTTNTKIIGVSWDYSSNTPKTLCRYDACIPIPKNYSDTSGISVQTLPGGFYATMRTTIEKGNKILLNWRLSDLILSTSPKFKCYQFESNMGPWYEVFSPTNPDGTRDIVLCTHLQPRSSVMEYPEYRGEMCSLSEAN